MQKRNKILLGVFVVIIIIGMGILGVNKFSGSKSTQETTTETIVIEPTKTPEDTLKEFLKYREDGELDKLADLVNDKYLEAMECTREQYIQNLKNSDFNDSLIVKDSKIYSIDDYSDNLKKAMVQTNVTIRNKDDIFKDIYALEKIGDKWMVSPMGVIEEKKLSGEKINEILSIEIPSMVKSMNCNYLKIKTENKSGTDVALGWAGSGRMLVKTTEGEFKGNIGGMPKFQVGYNQTQLIEVPGMKGDIQSVTIGPIMQMNGSLPEHEKRDYTINFN